MQTDSFIAVQLIEQQKALNLSSLKCMAEQVEGSFSFSVLSEQDELWLVKGDNPLTIVHFPAVGVYVYASTAEILNKALARYGNWLGREEKGDIAMGDIIKIDSNGRITAARSMPPSSTSRRGGIGIRRCTRKHLARSLSISRF